MKKVSIIVPIYGITYNILKNCIESLINQTLKEIEIILIDDGNRDYCGKLCDEYSKKDSRVVVIHQENSGVSIARNRGIEAARSPYIAFVDADDWVDSNTFEVAIYYAEKYYYPDVVLWEYRAEKENSVSSNELPKNEKANLVTFYENYKDIEVIQRAMIGGSVETQKGMHGGPVCKLYKREILFDYNIRFKQELRRSQDNEFNFRYFEYVSNAIYIKREFYHYRMFSGSATHKYRADSKDIQEAYLNELLDNFKKFAKTKVFYEDFDYIVVGKFADICRTDYAHPLNPLPLRKKVSLIKRLIEQEPYQSAINRVDRHKFKKVLKIVIPLAKFKFCFSIYIIFILRYYLKKIIT